MSESDRIVFAEVVTKTLVTNYRMRCLLCSALEGGSNYWYRIEDYDLPDGVRYEDFREGGKYAIEGEYWHPAQLIPFFPGAAVIFSVPEDGDGKAYRLDRGAMVNGLQIMADKFPKHWSDFVNEDDDATTADCWLQVSLFQELRYC